MTSYKQGSLSEVNEPAHREALVRLLHTHDPCTPEPFQLHGTVKHHLWGKLGKQSYINGFSQNLPVDLPAAELWFGTHPSGESTVTHEKLPTSIPLSTFLSTIDHPENRFLTAPLRASAPGRSLPFLAKILSIAEPLSLQAHPNKAHATDLNRKMPLEYPDTFHKPEIGVALTPVSLLAGFRTHIELQEILSWEDPWTTLLASKNATATASLTLEKIRLQLSHAENSESVLRYLCEAVLQAAPSLLEQSAQKMLAFAEKTSCTRPLVPWFTRLAANYGYADPGLILMWLLNLIELAPGEAVFLSPGILHAYLAGDLFECMAPSDNTVRAGFTPKFIDKKSLLTILDFTPRSPCSLRVLPTISHHKNGGASSRFDYYVDAEEFAVTRIEVEEETLDLPLAAPHEFIALCLKGYGKVANTMIAAGTAFYFPCAPSPYYLASERGSEFFLIAAKGK